MALTQEAVDNLKAIHEEVAGEKLSHEEVWEVATRLLELGHLLMNNEVATYPQPYFDSAPDVINNDPKGCERRSMPQAL